MIIALIVAVPGVTLLVLAACSGLFAARGRSTGEMLVAPRNAGFGEASRMARAEATREQARADLRGLTAPKAAPALVLLVDNTQSDRRAA